MKIHGVCCETETFWPFNVRAVVALAVVARLPKSISTKLQQWGSVRVCLSVCVCVCSKTYKVVLLIRYNVVVVAVCLCLFLKSHFCCLCWQLCERCLAIIWVVLQQRQLADTQIPAHTDTHDSSTCAYNYFVYICMATQTESVRNIVMRIRSVCHIHIRWSRLGSTLLFADVCNMLPCYVVNVAFYYFTHIPVRVCAPLCVSVCVCCHQLSLFQTSLGFCFIYISTRVCQGLPRLPSNFLCNDTETDNQTAAAATTTAATTTTTRRPTWTLFSRENVL